MLSFVFSEEQELFRKSVRTFAQKELAPGYLDRARKDEFPWELIQMLKNNGLYAINLPPEYGGQGADCVTTGIAIEEIAKADFNAVFCIGVGGPLEKFGTEEQKQEWLTKMGRGECFIGIALTEPDCGSDAAAIRTTAVRDGDYYIVNGEKSSISGVTWMHAFYLYAKTNPKAGARGVTCFILPRDLPGVSISRFHDMGCRPIGRGALALEDVRIPVKNRIGEEGMGFKMVMGEFDFIRVFIALQCLGAAQASLEEAIVYARERSAFGKPIARFEGVSFPIVEHYTRIEAARLLSYKALWLRDQGLPHTKEAAMVKWWAPRLSVEVIHDCLLIHGHLGYSDEFPLEQRLRDVIGFQIADGTAQIQKIVVAREIIGRDYLPY
jgi:cyclohexanecarboxyl-CoA dehydrogenase